MSLSFARLAVVTRTSRQLVCAVVSLPIWIPADARQAAQIMAVRFPSKELLDFPGKTCKVSRETHLSVPRPGIVKCIKATSTA